MLPHGAFLSYSPSFTPAASANKFAFWASFFYRFGQGLLAQGLRFGNGKGDAEGGMALGLAQFSHNLV
jgi:hypothetical protein